MVQVKLQIAHKGSSFWSQLVGMPRVSIYSNIIVVAVNIIMHNKWNKLIVSKFAV